MAEVETLDGFGTTTDEEWQKNLAAQIQAGFSTKPAPTPEALVASRQKILTVAAWAGGLLLLGAGLMVLTRGRIT